MALMDSDERQQLFESLVDFYSDTFRHLTEKQRTSWLSEEDELVIMRFCVGDAQTVAEAEQKHAVKLLAIAHALMSARGSHVEREAIDQLLQMGFEAQERAEKSTGMQAGQKQGKQSAQVLPINVKWQE